MGRPQGSLNKPGGKKPGRKTGQTRYFQRISDAQRLVHKKEILEELLEGRAFTLTQAAKNVGVDPIAAWSWSENDKDFGSAIRSAREVRADGLEDTLAISKNIIAQIFLLKGYRPMFRDSYKVEHSSPKLEEWLKELKEARKEPAQLPAPSPELIVSPPVEDGQFSEIPSEQDVTKEKT